MDPLESLVVTAQQGDLNAFTQIVYQFQDMAYAVAYSASSDPQLAEDAAQEAFVEAYHHLPTLETAAAFPGWFHTIVRRQVNRLTRRKQLRTLTLHEAIDIPIDQEDLCTLMEQNEMRALVQEAIQTLPEHERQVVALFYIADYSQKEIAGLLGIRVATVKNRLLSARKRLRERITNLMQDDLQAQRPSNHHEFADRVVAMLTATYQGDTAKAAALLRQDPLLLHAVGPVDYWSIPQSPLHVAVTHENRAMIDFLLHEGADINARDPEGQRPLDLVAGWNQPMTDFLLERGAELDIFSAAILGDLKRVHAFLAADPALATTRGPEGATPLHVAATVEIAQLLLDYGADINALDSYTRRPPIGWAAGGLPVRHFLLAKGAAVDNIMLACRIGDLDRVKTFLQADPDLLHTQTATWDDHGEGATLLHIAAAKGGAEMTQFFLEQGLDPNAHGGWWQVRPLHWAVEKPENMAVIQLLIEQGADVNAKSGEKGISPLHYAVNAKNLSSIRYLAEHGADIQAKTDDGETALDWARHKGQTDIANYLQQQGAMA